VTGARKATFSFGIEEEFFLAAAGDFALPERLPDGFVAACKDSLGEWISRELLQPQIEISSPVFHDEDEARERMTALRGKLCEVAGDFDLLPVASGTYPCGRWQQQWTTQEARYAELREDFQIVGRRSLLSGLHVHVEIPDGVDRVALMNRLMPWLPLFLALSTSAPFWGGLRTGLKSYRQVAYDEWPRSGIPDFFEDEGDYERFVALLRDTGAVDDASMLWWTIRPALRLPTLELRIADCCTDVDDAVALASLFRCLVRAHVRQPALGSARTTHTRRIIDENRWRASRYGIEASFIDEPRRTNRAVPELVDDALALLAEDIDALRCEHMPAQLRRILERGTSADRQLSIYRRLRDEDGADRAAALRAVAEWLAHATRPCSGRSASAARSGNGTSRGLAARRAMAGHASQAVRS
jgi:carboxylate-amine ligase